ncbi:MAG: glycosyltransferase [Akkermansiaceae bacterium]|nr:glycosyltransferase [Akkermansiaceae bacterium]
MKVATCTPVNFEASPRFFSRDTGLLCRGFQQAGIDCRVIMPGTAQEDDAADLVRCSPAELEDPLWWKTMGINLVVLYAWANPKYLNIAKAIRAAGIHLIQSVDTAALRSPYADLETWCQATIAEIGMPQPLASRLRRLARTGRDFIPALFDHRRVEMMAECDALAAVSPPAMDSMADFACALGRPDVAKKMIVVPHPVSSEMTYGGEMKIDHVLVVGRWGKEDQTQKDPQLTLKILEEFLAGEPNWTAEIIGPEATGLAALTSDWKQEIKSRLTLTNFIPHAELRQCYATSKISLCASRFESFHIASAEAVCSGCSVVIASHPNLVSTAWFTTRNSGTLAQSRKKKDLVEALKTEATAWHSGNRQPTEISAEWQNELHCNKIARAIADANS